MPGRKQDCVWLYLKLTNQHLLGNVLIIILDGILNEGPFVLFTFLHRKFVKELRKNWQNFLNNLRTCLMSDVLWVGCTALGCTAWGLHCIGLHCMELHCLGLHCMGLHCMGLHCMGLHCMGLHCMGLHCMGLHCMNSI